MKSIGSSMGLASKSTDSLTQQFGVLALLLSLWALNLFPVQKAQQVLTASALVSNQRLASLQKVAQQQQLPSDSIRWVHYQRDPKPTVHPSVRTGVEHIQLRIGIRQNATADRLQSELQRLTEPSIETAQTLNAQAELRAERWRRATIEHQLALFELDRSREQHAAQTGLDQDEAQGGGMSQGSSQGALKRTTEVRSVVHRKQSSDSTSEISGGMSQPTANAATHLKTKDSLLSSLDRCSERIERMESTIKQSRTQASGTIAITGAPRIGVLSTPASVSQALCVFFFTLLSCTGLVFFLKVPLPKGRMPRGYRTESHQRIDQALDRLGLRNLGAITLERASATPSQASIQEPLIAVESKRQFRRIEFVRRLSDGLLILWVAAFTVRFLTDGAWRELLFSAPLSAFSSLVFGV